MTQVPQQPEAQPTNSPKSTKWIAISAAAVGGVILLGAIGAAALSGIVAGTHTRSADAQEYVLPATGITQLDVENAAADMRIQCSTGSAEEFTLAVPAGSRVWSFERDGDTLEISPERNWLSWFSFGGASQFREYTDVTLTMPASACDGTLPLSASFDVGAGQLDIDGEFGELDLTVGAGTVLVNGAAHTVTADIAVGESELNLRDVRTADLTVAAGDLNARFTGTAPQQIDLEVAVGDATLWLPDQRYAVTSEVAVGDLENGLLTDQSATDHQIFVEVAAGTASLQPHTAE